MFVSPLIYGGTQPICGKAILVGFDSKTGQDIPATISLEDLQASIRFLSDVQVDRIKKANPHIFSETVS